MLLLKSLLLLLPLLLRYPGLNQRSVFGRFGETSNHVKGLLLGMAARAQQQVGRVSTVAGSAFLRRSPSCIATLSTGSRFTLAKQCRGSC